MGSRNVEKLSRKIRETAAPAERQELDLEALITRLVVPPTDLESGKTALPTQRAFILDPTMCKAYMGLVGCAKTVTLCASAILPALWYPGSRWLVTRANQWTLEDTTMRTFREMVNRLGPGAEIDFEKEPLKRLWMSSARVDERGNPREPSEIIFHAVDDLQKIGSTEFDGIIIDEASEFDSPIVHALRGRLRHRRPDGEHGPYFFNLAFNPTSRNHWLYQELSGSQGCPEPWAKLFRPKSRENAANLPRGYYETMAKGMSPELRLRLVEGEWGPDPRGEGVFSSEFRTSLHVEDLKPVPGWPMIRAWDFGRRRPACVWAQVTPEGWVNRLYCKLGHNKPLRSFAQEVLLESAVRFPDAVAWKDFCDPHGTQKKDDGKSSIEVLFELGIHPLWRDAPVSKGLEIMSRDLMTLVRGRPRSRFDRTGCQMLIEGYNGGFIYAPPRAGGGLREEPFKDGFYEHLMDADRYLALNLALGSTVPVEQHAKVLRKVRSNVTGY